MQKFTLFCIVIGAYSWSILKPISYSIANQKEVSNSKVPIAHGRTLLVFDTFSKKIAASSVSSMQIDSGDIQETELFVVELLDSTSMCHGFLADIIRCIVGRSDVEISKDAVNFVQCMYHIFLTKLLY